MKSVRFRVVARTLMIILVTVLVCSTPALCQDQGGFARRHVVEIGGSMYFETDGEFQHGFFTVSPYIGYFMADGFEAGISASLFIGSYYDSPKAPYSIDLVPSYNFATGGSVYPFVEGVLGYHSLDHVFYGGSRVHYGARVGLKATVGGKALLLVGVKYLNESLDRDGGRRTDEPIVLTAGFSIWLD